MEVNAMKFSDSLRALLLICILLFCFQITCAKSGKDSEGKDVPAEFFTTWSLYRDCPTNLITFHRDGTFEFVDCYHDEKGEEKRDKISGKFVYLGNNKIKIDRPGGVLNEYEISEESGTRVLRSSGFIFYSSFK